MGQFLKFMFASMLGTLLIGVVLIVLFFGMLAAAAAGLGSKGKPTKIKDGSVLQLTLDNELVDRGDDEQMDFDFGPFQGESKTGLNQVLAALDQAKSDEKIEGIFLDLTSVNSGFATLREIRNKLMEFKKESGKPVVAWAEFYTQGSYYLATAADQVYLQPKGMLDYRGLQSEYMFLKGLFEKLDIDMQFIRGSNNKFKSFGEVYTEEQMSPANRAQIELILRGLWADHRSAVSEKTGLSANELDTIANTFAAKDDEAARDLKLVDALMYRDELLADIKERMSLDKEKDIAFVSLGKYLHTDDEKEEEGDAKTKLAVIYAEGGISSGDGDDGIGSTSLSATIREAREDSAVKAIVLRVNSPGGSGLASEVIWREVKLAAEAKPLVVSMGDVAASGGYYISCPATKIYAEPTTITGSIGVFGLIPNMQGFFKNKLGITFDGAKTHEYADMMTVSRPLTETEKRMMQQWVDDFYDGFVERVAEGRKLTTAQVDSIGQGRVWTGADAKERGLVDELGGLEDAIRAAATLANISDYRKVELPEQEDFLKKLLKDLNTETKAWVAREYLGEDAKLLKEYQRAREAKEQTGILARMPYDLIIQ
ncbi:MAG: signal peptide peptidase SppA [Flavobacteriales bacterium]|nr:signal peptide peptidase SppA [Flavobacteriales bacterium]